MAMMENMNEIRSLLNESVLPENQEIEGGMSFAAFAKAFPDVQDHQRFRSALAKLMKGGKPLSVKEKDEVVNAFRSMLAGSKQDDALLYRMLGRLEEKDVLD
jgi:hypothetical protein